MAFSFFRRKSRSKVPNGLAEAIRAIHASNHYEALKRDPTRERRKIRMDLTETEQVFRGMDRISAYAEGDHLYDNDSVGSTLDTCVRLAIGTGGGMPVFTGPGASDAQRRFDAWKKEAGFSENEHFSDLLKQILRTVKLHGDCMVLVDQDMTDGKLRIWDADQICPLMAADFTVWCARNDAFDAFDGERRPWRQVEGAVVDNFGRCRGHFVTMLRNRIAVAEEDATFIPLGLGRRVCSSKKVSQFRGEPLFLPNADITNDTRSLIKSEVKGAQNTAELALIHRRGADSDNRALSALTDALTPEEATAGTDITPEGLQALVGAADRGADFQAFAGKSAIGEIAHDADIINLNNANRPSQQIQSWLDNLADQNSKRMGVMSLIGRGRADNSYSSGQIEISISWAQFAEDQKMLERQVVDYVCGVLFPGEPYIVEWPQAFEVDPQKAEQTLDARLRGGRATFREILGPRYQDRLRQLAEDKRLLESLGLTNLSFFQSVSGVVAEPQTQTEQENQI